jgi:thiamine biosynthesis lipoprotein
VNVGGDLRAEGDPGRDGSWAFEIDPERTGTRAALVGMRSGALATSTRGRRTLGPAPEGRHHLIDPETGRPAATGVRSVSVLAGFGWQAEVAAKAALVSGVGDGRVLLDALGLEGLLIDDRGLPFPTPGFARFTGGVDPARVVAAR